MQQFEADQAFDEVQFVKTRLRTMAEKETIARRKQLLELVDIIDTGMVAAYTAGRDSDLNFPTEKFTREN